ncbi:unnamed protein product [Echinostoma caproni]|uniref:Uncharacterized protein n=1 Tax=Echinostoma caproni TaxID=27848 RepID=A0A3P8B6N6_9TREM|nr:unnamed protein product [Echinostoma caproni]
MSRSVTSMTRIRSQRASVVSPKQCLLKSQTNWSPTCECKESNHCVCPKPVPNARLAPSRCCKCPRVTISRVHYPIW